MSDLEPIALSDSLIDKINEVVSPFGCCAIDLGEMAVRETEHSIVRGPSAVVDFPRRCSSRTKRKIRQLILQQVPGITKVLQHRN
ncbi:MAG: hypothetical protein JWO43_87 [Candidatus Adlerbacteria bacterium]|nr:hypothetical protein [Candidatus Adlerbacteria bacterium]